LLCFVEYFRLIDVDFIMVVEGLAHRCGRKWTWRGQVVAQARADKKENIASDVTIERERERCPHWHRDQSHGDSLRFCQHSTTWAAAETLDVISFLRRRKGRDRLFFLAIPG
jgi:hypothetical protein